MKKSGISDTSGQGRNWPAERRFQRIGCDLNARFLYQDQWRPAKIITLSGGGAFLACKRRVKNNQVIYLEFDLDDQPISAISRVVWKKNGAPPNNHFSYPPGFAVEFESMEGKERVSVNQYVIKSLRIIRALQHELDQSRPDYEKIKNLYLALRPGDSLRISHIRKIVRQESRHFRLRKIDA